MGFKLGDLVFVLEHRLNRAGPGIIVYAEECEPDECCIQVMWPAFGLNWECPLDLIPVELVVPHG